MLRYIYLSILFITLLASPCLAKTPIRTIEGIVTRVSDGDTIQVTDGYGSKVKIRLYGMDAPETEKSNHKTGRVSRNYFSLLNFKRSIV
jgi:endonuclease YncB( thermonuclease family)